MNFKNLRLVSFMLVITLLVGCSGKDDIVAVDKKDNKNIITTNTNDDAANNDMKDMKDMKDKSKSTDMSNQNPNSSNANSGDGSLQAIYFGFDNYLLSNDMISKTSQNAAQITSLISANPNAKIKLEGNCDEWGNDEYNFALGLKRTKSVKKELINKGIDASSIIVVSLGEGNPVCTDHHASCWKQNRRVDHKLTN